MGRRSVPKSAKSVDLTGWLYTPAQLPSPWDPQPLFGGAGPLEVEVGCGKGLFLINAAAALPTHHFLGIEVAQAYAKLTAARLATRSLKNAIVVQGDARSLLADRLPDGGVEAVHVYFPDPWWKKRHQRRRVMTQAFVIDIERVLVGGGRLHFWTDVKEYFDATVELIKQATGLEGPFDVSVPPPLHDMDYRTHFERRVRSHKLPVYRAEFAKPAWRVEYEVDFNTAASPSLEPSAPVADTDPAEVERQQRLASLDLLNRTHTFPGRVMIKVIGLNTEAFQEGVRQAARQLPLAEGGQIEFRRRETAGGRHLAITFEPLFEEAEQVLALYDRLRQIPEAVMLL